MDRTLVILFSIVLFLAGVASAKGPDDVAGIRWDVPPTAVRQSMSNRPGVALESEEANTLKFSGGTLADLNVKSWKFGFDAGKFNSVLIVLAPRSGKDAKGWFADQDFHKLEKLLEQKYGKAKVVGDQNHQARYWEFRDSLFPGALKTIELYRGWAGVRNGLELTYSFDRNAKPAPPKTGKPTEDL